VTSLAKKTVSQQHTHEMTKRQLSHHKKAIRRQRIIFIGGIGVIAAVIIIIVAGWLTGEYLPMHKAVIKVKDTTFSSGYFVNRLKLQMTATDQQLSVIGSLATNLVTTISQEELEKEKAAELGVKVSEADIDAFIKQYNWPNNKAARDYARANLLPAKLKSDYFTNTVSTTDNQVYLTALMCQSEDDANSLRLKLQNGENITALADQYAMGYFSKNSKGDFGLHPQGVFKSNQVPSVPLDYAFQPDTTVGAVSEPLADNVSQKQMGYWLICVNDRPTETTANVTAILCTDNATAIKVKQLLLAGGDVSALATQYTQYTTASNGALGVIPVTDNTSDTPTYLCDAVHKYIFFDDSTKLGVWSEPMQDVFHWTKGGYWIVKIDDRQINSQISDADIKSLINTAYATWSTDATSSTTQDVTNLFTDEVMSWVIGRASKDIKAGKL
jgi:hypothetical protein